MIPQLLAVIIGKTLEWRRVNKIDHLFKTYVPPEVVVKYFPFGEMGIDKFGCPSKRLKLYFQVFNQFFYFLHFMYMTYITSICDANWKMPFQRSVNIVTLIDTTLLS